MDNKALITTEQSGNLVSIDKTIINTAIKEIQERHKEVSMKETPRLFIKKKLGNDYVQLPYMRKIADTFYPGWSWEIVKPTIHTNGNSVPEFVMIHGRLKWYESGLWRSGDMVAAHRIQKKTGSQTDLVDPGNDIKAGNTDCMKKAMNVFMNIADDVYKAQAEDPELSDEQREQILILARQLKDKNGNNREKEFADLIDEGTIHTMVFKGTIAKLNRLVSEKENNISE